MSLYLGVEEGGMNRWACNRGLYCMSKVPYQGEYFSLVWREGYESEI